MQNWGIVGHEWAVNLLAGRIAQGRISHATLITGPAGVGKMALAIRLAQAINCTETDPPCGACRTCDLIGRGQHPDLHIIVGDNGRLKIEAIRDMQNTLALRPYEAQYRVAILPDFHNATDQAMDALLKTLEEPPSGTKIIVTAEAAESLLPTIRSRCQEIALRPVPVHQIVEALMDQHNMRPTDAALLARLSGGRPGWALTMAQRPEAMEARSAALDDLVMVLGSNRIGRFAYADTAARSDDLTAILDVWQSWWRDVLLCAEGSSVAPVHADRIEQIQEIAQRLEAAAARRALNAVRLTTQLLERSINTRLALEIMMLEMPYL